MRKLPIIIGLAVICGLSLGATAVYLVSQGSVDMAGSLVDVPYQPTSEWIEEGVDPNVTKFGFEKGQPKSAPGQEVSEAQLYQFVQTKYPTLMPCYADALEDDDSLQGKVDMQFGIASDGRLSLVKVTSSSLRSKRAEDCFVQHARDWKFPPTGSAALVKFDTDFTFVYE